MDRKAIEFVMNYLETQGTPAQITYENGEYVLDIQNTLHAKVIVEELEAAGLKGGFWPSPHNHVMQRVA